MALKQATLDRYETYMLVLQDLLDARDRKAKDALRWRTDVRCDRVLLTERTAAALALEPRTDAEDVVKVLARQHFHVHAAHKVVEADRTHLIVIAVDAARTVRKDTVRFVVVVASAVVVERDAINDVLRFQELLQQNALEVAAVRHDWELPRRVRASALANELEDRRRQETQATAIEHTPWVTGAKRT